MALPPKNFHEKFSRQLRLLHDKIGKLCLDPHAVVFTDECGRLETDPRFEYRESENQLRLEGIFKMEVPEEIPIEGGENGFRLYANNRTDINDDPIDGTASPFFITEDGILIDLVSNQEQLIQNTADILDLQTSLLPTFDPNRVIISDIAGELTTDNNLTYNLLQLTIPSGNRFIPGLAFTADTNTGMYRSSSPSGTRIEFSINSTDALNIFKDTTTEASGIAVNFTDPTASLDIAKATGTNFIRGIAVFRGEDQSTRHVEIDGSIGTNRSGHVRLFSFDPTIAFDAPETAIAIPNSVVLYTQHYQQTSDQASPYFKCSDGFIINLRQMAVDIANLGGALGFPPNTLVVSDNTGDALDTANNITYINGEGLDFQRNNLIFKDGSNVINSVFVGRNQSLSKGLYFNNESSAQGFTIGVSADSTPIGLGDITPLEYIPFSFGKIGGGRIVTINDADLDFGLPTKDIETLIGNADLSAGWFLQVRNTGLYIGANESDDFVTGTGAFNSNEFRNNVDNNYLIINSSVDRPEFNLGDYIGLYGEDTPSVMATVPTFVYGDTINSKYIKLYEHPTGITTPSTTTLTSSFAYSQGVIDDIITVVNSNRDAMNQLISILQDYGLQA